MVNQLSATRRRHVAGGFSTTTNAKATIMRLKNFGPDGIAWIARCSVVRAYHKMRRNGSIGEAERLRYSFGDIHRKNAAELIVANLPNLLSADVRQIIRELSTCVCIHAITAEINYRKRR